MNKAIRKIAIVGPESTGKSTLSRQMAKHYHKPWVPEYARFYCAALTAPCTLQDELNMFHGQLALEEAVICTTEEDLVFCDTTVLTVKIWCDAMMGGTPQMVLDTLPERPYDLYLLMDIDLPWEEDPLRDFPDQREHFMGIWHKELRALRANYIVVSGWDDRLSKAIAIVDHFLLSI